MSILRSADLLVDMIVHNPSVLDAVKSDPEKTLRKLAKDATKNLPPPPLVGESGVYYVVVIALGVVAVAAIGGSIWATLSVVNGSPVQIPETITALGSAAIGALAGLLVPSPGHK